MRFITINSAFDTYDNKTTVRKIVPNYAGIAVVAGLSAYASYLLSTPVSEIGPVMPLVSDGVLNTIGIIGIGLSSGNISPNQDGGGLDFLYNIRSKNTYSSHSSTEIKSDLNFNSLTTH